MLQLSVRSVAGLSVWATIDKSTRVEAQVAVAVVSITSAIAALVPRVKNYGEMAGQARQLSSSYGRVEGHLFNAYQQPEENWNYEVLQRIVEEFDSVKSSKDTNLRDLPPRISYGRPPDSGWPPDTYYRSRQEERQERHRYRRLGFRPRFWRGPNLGGAPRAEQAVVVAVVADVPAGDTGALQEYERQVLPALESHGGRVERSLRSADNRSQVHIISFASRHNYESYLVDRAGAPAAAGVEPRLLDVADLVPPGHN